MNQTKHAVDRVYRRRTSSTTNRQLPSVHTLNVCARLHNLCVFAIVFTTTRHTKAIYYARSCPPPRDTKVTAHDRDLLIGYDVDIPHAPLHPAAQRVAQVVAQCNSELAVLAPESCYLHTIVKGFRRRLGYTC